ncbi:MAG: hypothetical protein HOL51_05385 [Gemmatimonadetes bacterium]|nr:hypothetical protein [Gemmatimonadota bacterium]
MRHALAIALVCMGGWSRGAQAVEEFRLGGEESWNAWTGQNKMMDDFTDPSALQPRELQPDENLLPQLGSWYRWKSPPATQYRPGNPRIWRGINYLRPRAEPRDYIDGDINTFTVTRDLSPADQEFYTIDVGTQVPLERFVFYPPEGNDPVRQEPYRPNFAFEKFELSGSNDERRVAEESNSSGSSYHPLDIILASRNLNVEALVELHFPLQYLRFLRIRFFPDKARFSKFALAEMEVYGRGFAPEATWESKVMDLGQVVNLGRVSFVASRWRREGEELVPSPSAPVVAAVQIKTGLDDTPIRYHSYSDIGQLVEVAQTQYDRLKQRIWPWDPPAVGWRGPIADDVDNWSFWSVPLRTSGQQPRVPGGRYLQMRVTLETETLWDFARLDSLAIEFSPLLAERVLGEVAAAGDLRPTGNLVEVPAGEKTEFVYDLRAKFTAASQSGFDAVRLLLPSAGALLGLEMGHPLQPVTPDSVVAETGGLVVYLPEPVRQEGVQALRLRLETTIYGASGAFEAEVFARSGLDLPQLVEAGDASEELGTDQLRVVATGPSLDLVLADVEVHPAAFTPQGDGINDQVAINYTLFRLLAATEVEVEIFTLSGRPVWRQALGTRQAGRHQVVWDGRDDRGQLVAPGIYLVRMRVETDQGPFAQVRNLAVVY